jgi:hypothetical protein
MGGRRTPAVTGPIITKKIAKRRKEKREEIRGGW